MLAVVAKAIYFAARQNIIDIGFAVRGVERLF